MLADRLMSAVKSGPSLIKSAYWRLYIMKTTSGHSPRIYELEFRPTKNVSYQPSSGSASASSFYYGIQPYYPFNAFDKNTSTLWQAKTSSSEWLQYQYANIIGPVQVYILSTTQGGLPGSFDVQYSLDGGTTWTTLKSFSNVTYSGNVFTGKIQ